MYVCLANIRALFACNRTTALVRIWLINVGHIRLRRPGRICVLFIEFGGFSEPARVRSRGLCSACCSHVILLCSANIECVLRIYRTQFSYTGIKWLVCELTYDDKTSPSKWNYPCIHTNEIQQILPTTVFDIMNVQFTYTNRHTSCTWMVAIALPECVWMHLRRVTVRTKNSPCSMPQRWRKQLSIWLPQGGGLRSCRVLDGTFINQHH